MSDRRLEIIVFFVVGEFSVVVVLRRYREIIADAVNTSYLMYTYHVTGGLSRL